MRRSMVALVFLGASIVGCGGSQVDTSSTTGLTVRPAEPTQTATQPPTPTPVAAITPSPVGFANPGTNAGNFPPPPKNPNAEPASVHGVSRLLAPKLGVDSYFEVVGVANNQMQEPTDGQYAVGWYQIYGVPGAGGNIMMSAHETWNHMQGPFYGLHKAALGDEIEVKMADGKSVVYKVISNHRYTADNMPMADIIWPKIRPSNEEWLTLLTCGGEIVYGANGFGEYISRDVVVARRVK